MLHTISTITKPQIKIYEMFMRDGLQSLKKVYPLETKFEFFNLLNQCNFNCIEIGSTTSSKLLPQMENSLKLFYKIKKNPNTKYTMLVPSSLTQTHNSIEHNVTSFGLVCSVSETFAFSNLKKTSRQTFKNVVEQMDIITRHIINPHIRVYLSCSFGSPWEDFDEGYLLNLETFIKKLLEYARQKKLDNDAFDIVISDTVGFSSEKRTRELLKMIWYNINLEDTKYLAMHIHSKENEFTKVISQCIDNNIFKFDSSMCEIGGCPFAEDKAFGNISTSKLIDYLKSLGHCENFHSNTLKYCEKELKKLL